jgi:branched-chain amino acid transport system permease protein
MSTTEQSETTQARPVPPDNTLLGRAVAAATGPTTPGRSGSTMLRHLLIAVVLVLVTMGLTYLLPSYRNYQLATTMLYLCVTAGLTVLVGLNGQISLGHGAIMAVGAYTTGFTQNYLGARFVNPPPPDAVGFGAVETVQGWTIFASILAGVLAGLLAGVLIGLAAARLRGPYLAGVTLAVAVIVPGITTSFDAFNGDQGIRVGIPPNGLPGLLRGDQWQVLITLSAAAIVMVLLANLINSRVGRNFRAVRDDEVSAQLSGIHVARTQVVAFVVSAATAGLAGALFTFLTANAQPGTFGLNLSLYLVLAIVLGGLGSLAGAVWGALFLVVVPYLTEQLPHLFSAPPDIAQKLTGNLPLAIFGLALIVVTILAPGGIQNLVRRFSGWLRGAVRRPASE